MLTTISLVSQVARTDHLKVKDQVFEIKASVEKLSHDQLSNLIQAHFLTGRKLIHEETGGQIQFEVQSEFLLLKQVCARGRYQLID